MKTLCSISKLNCGFERCTSKNHMLMLKTNVFISLPIQVMEMYRGKCTFGCARYNLSLRLIIYRSRESAVKMVLNKINKQPQKGIFCSRNTCHNQAPLSVAERAGPGCLCKQSTLEQLDKMLQERCSWVLPLWRLRWIPRRWTQLPMKPPVFLPAGSVLPIKYTVFSRKQIFH